MLLLDHQAWGTATSNLSHSSFLFVISPTTSSWATQLFSPESQGNGHKSTPCAWMSIRGQSSRWGHFHPGKKGCHGCCHVAFAGPGRAGHAAGTKRCNRPPSPPHCVPLERRCCGGWLRCSALSGWCEEGSSAPPTKAWRRLINLEENWWVFFQNVISTLPCHLLHNKHSHLKSKVS